MAIYHLDAIQSARAPKFTLQESTGVLTKHWLAIFLMTLVALQAVTVAADVHRFHQSQDHHLELGLAEHADQHLVENRESSQHDTDAEGCSHCCHCHGSFHAVFCSHLPTLYVDQLRKLPAYHAVFSSTHPTTFFRPPKA